MTAFDQAWTFVKGKDAVAEFEGNDICPDCGGKMEQTKNQLAHGYPVVYGFWCNECEYFKPHDTEYAHTPQETPVCGKCKGSGEQKEHNRRRDSYECDWCNGTGEFVP